MTDEEPRCRECSKVDRILRLIRGAALSSTPPLITLTLLVHEVRGLVGS